MRWRAKRKDLSVERARGFGGIVDADDAEIAKGAGRWTEWRLKQKEEVGQSESR